MSKQRKGSRSMLLAVALLMLSVLLGSCGTDQPAGGLVQIKSGIVTGSSTTVGLTPCTSCHSSQTTAWMASKHGNANVDPSGAGFYPAPCKDCHEPNGEGSEAVIGYSGLAPRVGCEACHGGGSDHVAAGGVGPIGFATLPDATIGGVASSLYVSAQFRTCAEKCHLLLNPNDPAGSAPTTTTGHSAPFNTSDVIITDTHFAKYMASFGSASLSGYAMDYSSQTVCIDCHSPHGTADINREWQKSAHADIYGQDSGYNRAAWTRNNWSCNGTSTAANCGTTSFTDRGFCQRCHTTEGFIAFADALRAGDTQRATMIRQGDLNFTFSGGQYTPLASVVTYTTAGWKPQMLKCNACHTDYKGTLRNPGAFTANYDYWNSSKLVSGPVISLFVRGLDQQYPDVLGSNICVTCHSGRESGETIKALNSDPSLSAFDFTNKAYFSPHELTGAGTVFGATGYEFSGRSYEDYSSYRHKNIGTSLEPGTGSNGPCVGCHMSRPNKSGNHLFLPITRAYIDPAGPFVSKQEAVITGIASEVCFKCHGPNDNVILDMVKEQKLLYAEAMEAVESVYELSGYFWNDGFYRQRDGTNLYSSAGAAVVTNASAVVTMAANSNRTFTSWLSANVLPGDRFRIDSDGTWYTILSVDSATQVTLTAPYAGFTGNGRYTIQKIGDLVSVTSGSTIVTGATSSWLASGVTGTTTSASSADHFKINSDGTWYQITARTANTLTLATPYAGPTSTAVAYTIRRARSTSNAITNYLTPPDIDTNGNGSGKKNMGAAFNLYVMESDPAGYVHNRNYMKRLMYDSIDWIDDNKMNYSVGTTLTAFCAGSPAPAWCTGAKQYILPNGVINGSAAERP